MLRVRGASVLHRAWTAAMVAMLLLPVWTQLGFSVTAPVLPAEHRARSAAADLIGSRLGAPGGNFWHGRPASHLHHSRGRRLRSGNRFRSRYTWRESPRCWRGWSGVHCKFVRSSFDDARCAQAGWLRHQFALRRARYDRLAAAGADSPGQTGGHGLPPSWTPF